MGFICGVIAVGFICITIITVSYINRNKPKMMSCQKFDCGNFQKRQEPIYPDTCDAAP